jgi:hypothetical protein
MPYDGPPCIKGKGRQVARFPANKCLLICHPRPGLGRLGPSSSQEPRMVPGDFRGMAVDDEIRAWNSTPLPGVRSFRNLQEPSVLRRLGSASPDFLVLFFLFGCSTSPHPFLAAQPLAPFVSQSTSTQT